MKMSLKVIKSITIRQAITNCVYVSSKNFESETYVKIDNFVFKVESDFHILENEIALNNQHRTMLNLNIGDIITPEIYRSNVVISLLKLQIYDIVTGSEIKEGINFKQIQKYCYENFDGHFFTEDQIFLIVHMNGYLRCKVIYIKEEIGKLTKDTFIEFNKNCEQ